MKKVVTLIVSVILSLSLPLYLGGCSDKNAESSSANLGQYNVDIKSAKETKGLLEEDVVFITINFTNCSDNNISFSSAVSTSAFQNGIGLNPTILFVNDEDDLMENNTRVIKPGVTIEVAVAFQLDDKTSPIEVECSSIGFLDNKKVSKIFKFKENVE